MKKIITLFVIALLYFSNHAVAQSYTTSLGIRLGTDWGLTVQQRIAKRLTIEGIAQSSLSREEVLLTGMVEHHFPLVAKRFNFYTGAGMHKGWRTSVDENNTYKNPIGVSLVGGVEITLAKLNVSWDFKPVVNVSGGEKSFYSQTGISVRYVLVKKNDELFDNGNSKERKKKKRQSERDRKKKKRLKEKEKRGKDGFNWKFWKKKE